MLGCIYLILKQLVDMDKLVNSAKEISLGKNERQS